MEQITQTEESIYEIYHAEELNGCVHVQGSKNAVLPMLSASLLQRGRISLTGCPRITDVEHTISILRMLGVKCNWRGDELTLDSSCVSPEYFRNMEKSASPEMNIPGFMRSSILFLGAMLGRFGQAFVPYPGGCRIGKRPIDLHLKMIEELGGIVVELPNGIYTDGSRMSGNVINLPFPSVGATENCMLASVVLKGTTVIRGAAKEPEIVALAEMLNRMGGKVFCAGTDCIIIEGVEKSELHGCHMTVPKDRIVAGTYLAAVAVTGGKCVVSGVNPKELETVLCLLAEMGCYVGTWRERNCPYISVEKREKLLFNRRLKTDVYPGFPTDLQSQFGVLLATIPGEHELKETIFESRFRSLLELKKMGANIKVKKDDSMMLTISGGCPLKGCEVHGFDLRGTAALAIAGLYAHGVTRLTGIPYLLRGYENFAGDMASLGARIEVKNMKLQSLPYEKLQEITA